MQNTTLSVWYRNTKWLGNPFKNQSWSQSSVDTSAYSYETHISGKTSRTRKRKSKKKKRKKKTWRKRSTSNKKFAFAFPRCEWTFRVWVAWRTSTTLLCQIKLIVHFELTVEYLHESVWIINARVRYLHESVWIINDGVKMLCAQNWLERLVHMYWHRHRHRNSDRYYFVLDNRMSG